MTAQTARVQVIHNCADLAAATVDVYLNDDLLVDDFQFRSASPFIDAPAGTEVEIHIAPANSMSAAESIFSTSYTLAEDETYILVASGIVSETGYSPAEPFGLQVYAMARETSNDPSQVDVLVYHGATDAPTVDVDETSVPAGTIVEDISYTEFSDYLALAELDYSLDIVADGNAVASYAAPLNTLNLEGNAITVLASGFLDPSINSNGPAFGLWVALPSGGALVELPLSTGLLEAMNSNAIKIFPNPSSNELWLEIQHELSGDYIIEISDLHGRKIQSHMIDGNRLSMNQSSIDVSQLVSGMYLLSIQHELERISILFQKR